MNKLERKQQVLRVAKRLDISENLAKDLLIMAGGDEDLVIECSEMSSGINECKANIIDKRLTEKEGKTNG